MKKIKLRQAIIDAIDETDENLLKYEAQCIKWGKYIERKIKSINNHKRFAKLFTVTGSVIELPEECFLVMDAYYGNYENDLTIYYNTIENSLLPNSDERADSDDEYIWLPMNDAQVKRPIWEQIGNELQFTSKFNSQEITVLYTSYEYDNENDIIINESHLEAIKKYIIYQFAKKYRWNVFKSEKLLRSSHFEMVNQLEREYNQEVRNARAEDRDESPYSKIK